MIKYFEVKKKYLLLIAGIFPDIFVAFFYTGLGCALFLAGVLFVAGFIKYKD